MKRKRQPPDMRLNWRDPDMPVIRPAMAPDDKEYKPYEFKPDWIQKYHEHAMTAPRVEPTWDKDPSYNWGKKRK